MRRVISQLPLLLMLALFGFGCGNSENGDDNGGDKEKEEEATKDLEEKDLSKEGLPGTIKLPKKDPNKGIRPAKLERNNAGKLVIKAGKGFGMSIFEGAPLMEMDQRKEDIRSMNQALETDFVKEADKLLIYKHSVPDMDKEMFHFYMVHEVGGQQFVIESLSNMEFSREQVDRMVRSAKTLSPKKEKSA